MKHLAYQTVLAACLTLLLTSTTRAQPGYAPELADLLSVNPAAARSRMGKARLSLARISSCH